MLSAVNKDALMNRYFALPPLGTWLAAIALAASAIPEGLPAIMTVTLALGVQRMARRHAIVRRLPAVETLGSVTVICSDKTGTLTRNEMTVQRVVCAGLDVRVSGAGYAPEGEFRVGERTIDADHHPALALALRAGVLCNDARMAGEAPSTPAAAAGAAVISRGKDRNRCAADAMPSPKSAWPDAMRVATAECEGSSCS